MNREEKSIFIDEIRGRFGGAPLVILADFRGVTVKQMDAFRRACEPVGVHFEVVKNTLAKRAVSGTSQEDLVPHFKGNIGVVFSGEDPIATAKLFRDTVKGNDKFVVRAGFFEGTVLDAKEVLAVAELPSREELLATLLRTIQEGPRQVLGVIQGPARDLVYVLSNYANKLEEQG